jgi:hypothetical protein
LNCTEKFSACHGRCPKDEQGDPKDPGYKMWLAEVQKIKDKKRAYEEERQQDHEDEKRRNMWRKKTF